MNTAAACNPVVQHERAEVATNIIRRAEQFLSGFEDDDSQDGIGQLLADVRSVLRQRDATHDTIDLAIAALDRLADGEDFNAVIEETGLTARLYEARRTSAPDPWHLFVIHIDEGDDVEGDRPGAFLVSAQSGSESKALELATAAVLDEAQDGATVTASECIGTVGIDVMQRIT
jgi:hypothetical protein